MDSGTGAKEEREVSMPPFHLAFPVHDLAKARQFYGQV